MKKYTKIVTLFSILTISLFLLVQETGAVSYGGSSQYTIPAVISNTGVSLYSVSAPASGFAYFFPVVDTENSAPRTLAFSYGLRFKSGSIGSYSGKLSTIYFGKCTNGYASYCYGSASTEVSLWMENTYTGSIVSSHFYIQVRYPDGGIDKLSQFYLDDTDASCPGTTTDCILIVQPRFYSRPTSNFSPGLYLAYSDYTFYNDGSNAAVYFRSYFGDLTVNGPTPTFYQSTLEFLGLGVTGFGLSLNFPYDIVTRHAGDSGGWGSPYYIGQDRILAYTQDGISTISGIGYDIVNANAYDDLILRDYFVGNTGTVLQTFPAWMGATSLSVSTVGAGGILIPQNGGSGSTLSGSIDYFSGCTNALQVGCYIKGFFTGVYDTIGGFFSSFFPDLSFSGEFNSCGSGSFSTGTTIPISQRFANVIAIINPIPPSDGSVICTIFGPREVSYQLLWPTENFFQKYIPGQVPALEIDPHIAYGQTLVDLITIFGMMSLIFYQKSKHD